MNQFELVQDVLEILSIVEDLIALQRAVSYSTAQERRAARNSVRLLRLARANIMRLNTTESRRWGSLGATGEGELGTPRSGEGEE